LFYVRLLLLKMKTSLIKSMSVIMVSSIVIVSSIFSLSSNSYASAESRMIKINDLKEQASVLTKEAESLSAKVKELRESRRNTRYNRRSFRKIEGQARRKREQAEAISSKVARLLKVHEGVMAQEAARKQESIQRFADVEYLAEQDRIKRQQEAQAQSEAQKAQREAEEERMRQASFQLGDLEYAVEQDRLKREQEAQAVEEAERLAKEADEERLRQASIEFAQQEYELEKARRESEEQQRASEVTAEQRYRQGAEAFADLENEAFSHLKIEQRATVPEVVPGTITTAPEVVTERVGPSRQTSSDEQTNPNPKPVEISNDSVQYVALKCETALNVRAGSSIDSNRLEDISCKEDSGRPTKTLILGYENGFYKVFVNGEAGWISSEFTSEPHDVEDGQASESDENIEPSDQSGTLKCRTNLNKRSGPSTSFRIVGKIPCKSGGNSTKVKVLGKHSERNWLLAEYNGEKAWVSARYVDVDNSEQLLSVTNDLLQGLELVEGGVDPDIRCLPGEAQVGDEGCVVFDEKFYTSQTSSKEMAASINEAKQSGTTAKKRRFLELFSPLALEIQTLTGWPASVSLAQMALETNWGTSNVFKRLNNFGGHSCFRRDANSSRALRNPALIASKLIRTGALTSAFRSSNGSVRLRSPCTYPRPRNEGAYYRSFSSVVDGAYLYADNVLENRAYASSQNYLKRQRSAGLPIDPAEIVAGLRPYAADRRYRSSLMATINANNLTQFDDQKTCQ